MAICALRLRVAAACGLGSGSRRGLMAAAGRTFCPLAAPLSRRMSSTPRTTPRQLQQVGQLETPKKESYAAGQLFLHRVFGYRGVVLFSWLTCLYDRNCTGRRHPSSDKRAPGGSEEMQNQKLMCYQVLVDSRDCPHIRAHVEAVAFLANDDDSPALYAIPGLDYANHDDILPYSSNDSRPIHHELFDHFFTATSENVSSSGTLRHTSEPLQTWQSKQQPWLKLSSIHRETTEGIRVSAMPFYMGMRETRSTRVYWWRYFIRLENLTESPVQLRERHWRIFSLSGTLETVRGRGVIGRGHIPNGARGRRFL
ncbi:polymerase delta-interacting protein 2-like isoform X2 [Erpetoichthys calabaricus]|uniref:polymerase delta-interacting protein 2-like isoform X2 n=1 Tax=Erpetoichthys calabaricus TaxID=27687 RepID=UPI002233F434|nr:polymerase delta-interacting protein 2-like isoform X2 [Erpetoichthys calabaricus]